MEYNCHLKSSRERETINVVKIVNLIIMDRNFYSNNNGINPLFFFYSSSSLNLSFALL